MKKLTGFTLSEVLITLGIIGVIAALTIPGVVGNFKVKKLVTQLKKTNSLLNNAYNLMREQEFSGDTSGSFGYMIDTDEFIDLMAKHLNTISICHLGDIEKCTKNVQYTNLSGAQDTIYNRNKLGAFTLNDGTIIMVVWFAGNQSGNDHIAYSGSYGQLFVDINGEKPPNKMGEDVFSFQAKKDRITARGALSKTHSSHSNAYKYDKAGYCDKSRSISHNGLGCTAWVVYMENMDYLK